LKDQGRPDEAMKQYRKSHELLQGRKAGRQALTNWAYLLQDLERFDEAVERAKQAIDAEPDSFWPYFDCANALSQSGHPNEALLPLDKAIERDREHPYPRHNRANLLFELGRYKDGWEEWRNARDCYQKVIEKAEDPERIPDLARDFGNVLAGIFNDYSAAE